MKKRERKELTLKEAKKRRTTITIIIISSVSVVSLLLRLATSEISINAENIIMAFAGILALWGLIHVILSSRFKINELEFKEHQKKEKEICKVFLSKESFTQVTFSPQEKSDETEMCLSILEKTRCTFFAKFDDEENIILIVKDKENKEIYKQEISNYGYFNLLFKKMKN